MLAKMESKSTKQNREVAVLDDEKVVDACREVGVNIDSTWDLVNSDSDYTRAIPTLLRILPEIEDPRVTEGLIRAVTVPEARGRASRPLIAAMQANRHNLLLAWAIANALSVVVTPEEDVFDELATLLVDEELGMSRQMLAEALLRTGDERTSGVLLRVLPQPELSGHVLGALGRLRARETAPIISGYVESKNPFVRREARKALRRMGIEEATRGT